MPTVHVHVRAHHDHVKILVDGRIGGRVQRQPAEVLDALAAASSSEEKLDFLDALGAEWNEGVLETLRAASANDLIWAISGG